MNNDDDEVFTPFLWALVERSVPSPIFVVGFTGVSRWLKGNVPEQAQGKELELQFPIVKEAILARQAEMPWTPFGMNIGYVFIRGLDDFHEFDLKGEYVGRFERKIPHIMAQTDLRVSSSGASLKGLNFIK